MSIARQMMMAAAGGSGGESLPPYSIDTRGTDGGLRISSVANSDFGTGDFTYEAWIYAVSSTASYNGLVGHRPITGGGLLYLRDDNSITFRDNAIRLDVGVVSDATWTHVAAVRSAGTLSIYVDGVSAGSVGYTRTISETSLFVGANGSSEEFQGYIWRPHVLNAAKYTADFTPQKGYGLTTGSLMLIEADAAGFTDLAGNTIINDGAVVVEFAP